MPYTTGTAEEGELHIWHHGHCHQGKNLSYDNVNDLGVAMFWHLEFYGPVFTIMLC